VLACVVLWASNVDLKLAGGLISAGRVLSTFCCSMRPLKATFHIAFVSIYRHVATCMAVYKVLSSVPK
jgi:hypothetical protein